MPEGVSDGQAPAVASVRAKFRCSSVRKELSGNTADPFHFTFHFNAVYGTGSEENKTFWKYTPSGTIDLTGLRSDLFVVGSCYYIDFSPAPE
ncbi:MAG: hypothetical protein P4L50_03125 [Anaerolineaceae bacterium]|nr:hypothetical protein [Anaerolineaceae bacterium]